MPTILGVRVDAVTREDALSRVSAWLASDRAHVIVTPNPEIILVARNNVALGTALEKSDLAIPDGVGLRFAAAALGEHLQTRLPGVDLLRDIARLCEVYDSTLLLLGGFNGAGEAAAERLRTELPLLKIETLELEAIAEREGDLLDDALRDELTRLAPQAIAVALGQGRGSKQGRQEKLVREIADKIPSVRVVIGVGGAFDFYAGRVQRAPRVFRRLGFEWLWRLARQPWRWQRIARAAMLFPILVALEAFKRRGFMRPLIDVTRDLFRHFFVHQSQQPKANG